MTSEALKELFEQPQLSEWSCLMRCAARRAMPQADSPEDHLYTFVNIDSDGVVTQIIEDDYFCEVGDMVRITITKN